MSLVDPEPPWWVIGKATRICRVGEDLGWWKRYGDSEQRFNDRTKPWSLVRPHFLRIFWMPVYGRYDVKYFEEPQPLVLKRVGLWMVGGTHGDATGHLSDLKLLRQPRLKWLRSVKIMTGKEAMNAALVHWERYSEELISRTLIDQSFRSGE